MGVAQLGEGGEARGDFLEHFGALDFCSLPLEWNRCLVSTPGATLPLVL